MSKRFTELPLVDTARFDQAFWTGEMSAELARVAQEMGPIFGWKARQGPEAGLMRVTMVGPEANRFVMSSHREHFSHDLGWTPLVGQMFGKGLLNMDEPEHGRHRKMWNPAFAGAYMGTYLPIMQSVIEERTSRWPERKEIDLYAECREITFDIAAAALAGFRTGAEVDRIREIFYALLHGFDDSDENYSALLAQWTGMQNELVGRLLAMIRSRRKSPPEERPRDVLSMIVHARDEDGNALSDEQVLAHLNILLVAGHETTTTLSTWALYLLYTMPEQRARVVAEIEETLGGEERPLAIDDIRGMRALDNFVRETGRLYPPVVNVPRGALQEFEFGGYTIPAGTQIRLALGGSHYLPGVFEDPRAFDPDRLAPPREEDRRTPYSLVTFGGGPRVCIGQHFALVETKALVAHVLRHYSLEPARQQRPMHAGYFNAFIPDGVPMRVLAR